MKFLHLLYFITLALLWSCSEELKPITHVEDYETYLSVRQTSQYSIQDDINFWSDRLKHMPNDEASKIKLAGLHAANFRKTGSVEMLLQSDSMYHHLLKTTSS